MSEPKYSLHETVLVENIDTTGEIYHLEETATGYRYVIHLGNEAPAVTHLYREAELLPLKDDQGRCNCLDCRIDRGEAVVPPGYRRQTIMDTPNIDWDEPEAKG